MLTRDVIEAARPYLSGRTVADAVVGLSLMAIQLDNGDVGVSYTLRDGLPSGCSIFQYAQELVGKPAEEIAEWLDSGEEDARRGLGMAALTAASRSQDLRDADDPGMTFGVRVSPGDTVGMIGFIPPVARAFQGRASRVYVFDQGLYEKGGDRGGSVEGILPTSEQGRLLPECDIVVLSGTTVVNHSLEGLLELCGRARDIVMVGTSTPMFTEAFRGTPVTVLAGSWWDSSRKDELFRKVSLAGGITQVQPYMIKKTVRVSP